MKISLLKFRTKEGLKQYITEQGKIIPRQFTGLSAKQQRKVRQAVKQARILGLLPFVSNR